MCLPSLLGVPDPKAVATAIDSLASARERATEGVVTGVVKVGEPALPGGKGAEEGKEPRSPPP